MIWRGEDAGGGWGGSPEQRQEGQEGQGADSGGWLG